MFRMYGSCYKHGCMVENIDPKKNLVLGSRKLNENIRGLPAYKNIEAMIYQLQRTVNTDINDICEISC
jgi:hypothetical protein